MRPLERARRNVGIWVYLGKDLWVKAEPNGRMTYGTVPKKPVALVPRGSTQALDHHRPSPKWWHDPLITVHGAISLGYVVAWLL